MSVQSTVLAGRAAAEARMIDTCTITRATGDEGTFDQRTGVFVPPVPLTIYSGKCRIALAQPTPATRDAGEHLFTVQTLRVDIPLSAAEVQVDDVITITTAALDSANVGREFTATGGLRKTDATAQRIAVEEVPA